MFKSKIFNSVTRYMLVAMLALLPNAIWASDNYTNNVFLTDVNRVVTTQHPYRKLLVNKA